MTAAQASGLLTLALNDGQSPGASPPFGRLLALSLALHCAVLVLVGNVSFSDTGPKPLTFHEVSLVTLSKPSRAVSRSPKRVAKAEPVKSLSKDLPVPQKANLSPAPSLPVTVSSPSTPAPEDPSASTPPEATPTMSPPKLIPMLPWPGSSAAEDRARSEALVREALSSIRLPPEHPAGSLPSQAPESSATHQAPLADLAEPIRMTPAPSLALTPEAKARSEALLREALDRAQLPSGQSRGRLPETDSRSEAMMRDVLSKIELPPETPKFQNLASLPTMTPTPTVPSTRVPAREVPSPPGPVGRSPTKEAQRQVDTILRKLKVPDIPTSLPPPQKKLRTFEQKQQRTSSLAEDIRKELRAIEEHQRTKDTSVGVTVEHPKGPEAVPSQLARKTDPVGKPARSEMPAISIQAPGAPSGSSQYLARVQHKISNHWVAPPVELTEQTLVVVIKFRLHRSGSVSNVVVIEPSGNPYYDLAAKRAVVRAEPLPSFPRSMRESYLNVNFTFAVREQLG